VTVSKTSSPVKFAAKDPSGVTTTVLLLPFWKKDSNVVACILNDIVDAAAKENVKMVCQRILQDSAPLRNLAEKGKIKVIGAYKMLSSGNVEFF